MDTLSGLLVVDTGRVLKAAIGAWQVSSSLGMLVGVIVWRDKASRHDARRIPWS